MTARTAAPPGHAAAPPPGLYAPPDAKLAYCVWAANCGPAAFAAVARRPLMQVGRFFPAFPARPWTNPTAMRAALDAAGVAHRPAADWPGYGLGFVQFEGPWEGPGVPVAAAYRRTHWVGAAGGLVYDVNADGWLPRADWEADLAPRLVAAHLRATGWRVRAALEVFPPAVAGREVGRG